MADQFLVADLGAVAFEADTTWENTPGGGEESGPPLNGEPVVLDVAGTNPTMNGNSNALASLDMEGFTGGLYMQANDLDSGDVTIAGALFGTGTIYCGGDLEILSPGTSVLNETISFVMDAITATKLITTNGVTIGALTINDAAGDAEFQLAGKLTCAALVITDGTFVTDDNALTCDSISGAAGTLTLGASTVVVGGTVDLANLAGTAGGAVFSIGFTFGIGAAGSFTLTDDCIITATTFEHAGGVINTATHELTVVAEVKYTAGTVTELLLTHEGTNDADWNTAAAAAMTSYTVDGDITLNGTKVFTNKFAGTGTLNKAGAEFLNITHTQPDDFWMFTGTCNVPVTIFIGSNVSSGSAIEIVDEDLILATIAAGLTLTMDGDVDVGAGVVNVFTYEAGSVGTLDMNGYGLHSEEPVMVGGIAGDMSGAVLFSSGTHVIGGLAAGHATANLHNAADFDTSNTRNTGTIDGDNIAVSATSANLVGGTIQKVGCTGILNCWGVIEAAGNSGGLVHHGGTEIGNPMAGAGRLAA